MQLPQEKIFKVEIVSGMIAIGLTDYDSSVTMFNDFLCVPTDVEKIRLVVCNTILR